MTRQILGPVDVSGSWDEEGHRTYKVTWKVEAESGDEVVEPDGPVRVLQTPGLPRIGSRWDIFGEIDVWAWCHPNIEAKPMLSDERVDFWLVTQTFSTKPPQRFNQRCQDLKIESPLLEPQKVSGESIDDKEEATSDRFGNPITNSAWEQLRGPAVEFVKSRHKIIIEQNVPALEAELWGPMQNTVNDRPLWGLPRRSVKLGHVHWERKFYGFCYKYFTRKFSFDIAVQGHPKNAKTVSDFDRFILDEGTKALAGDWQPNGAYKIRNIDGKVANPLNPSHFIKFKDRQGNNTKVILDGSGKPYIVDAPTYNFKATPGTNDVVWPQYLILNGKFTSNLKALDGVTLTADATNPSGTPSWSINVPNFGLVSLSVDPNSDPLTFTLTTAATQATWFKFFFDWTVMGSNTLDYDQSTTLGPNEPASVTVTPGSNSTGGKVSQPGYRYIEYYKEANFLLLGIPLFF